MENHINDIEIEEPNIVKEYYIKESDYEKHMKNISKT